MLSAKRRIMLSILSICMVCVFSITSISLVLASLTANVGSGFSVTYTAPQGVKAGIIGGYRLEYQTIDDSYDGYTTLTNNDKYYLEFDGSQTEQSFDEIGTIEIPPCIDNPRLTFYFIIFNFGDEDLTISFALQSLLDNIDYADENLSFNGSAQYWPANAPGQLNYATLQELQVGVSVPKSENYSNMSEFTVAASAEGINPSSNYIVEILMNKMYSGLKDVNFMMCGCVYTIQDLTVPVNFSDRFIFTFQ